MAHADASRVNQSLNRQSQLLFGYGQQRCESPISQATPHDVRLRPILRRKRTLMSYNTNSLYDIYVYTKQIVVPGYN